MVASGRTFVVRRPEMVKVINSNLLLFTSVGESPEVFDEWEIQSLMMIESISRPGPSAVGSSNA